MEIQAGQSKMNLRRPITESTRLRHIGHFLVTGIVLPGCSRNEPKYAPPSFTFFLVSSYLHSESKFFIVHAFPAFLVGFPRAHVEREILILIGTADMYLQLSEKNFKND